MTDLDASLPLALLVAHLVGDFILQPTDWVRDRREHGMRSWRLVQHALLHTLLALLAMSITTASLGGWLLLMALALGTSHWLIDLGKVSLEQRYPRHPLALFLLDQALHLSVILVLWLMASGSLAPLESAFTQLTSPKALGLIAAYLIVTRPMSLVIAMIMKPLADQLDAPGTLSRAGARIGIFERLLLLTLTLFDQLMAASIVIAAKSVLRYGDLKEQRDRKLTEYVLLGTLISVSSTLILGLLVRTLL
uniref:DUF3307 domain-containing protein n=1 Tax=Halomonas sp. TaxID=1486246 RepID=UPI002612EBCA|nr:DUF3307 domain-containing protein [Halomonas sp.]